MSWSICLVSPAASTTTTTTAPATTTTDSTKGGADRMTGDGGDGDARVAGGGGAEPMSRRPGVPALVVTTDLITGPLGAVELQQVEVLGAELDADFSLAVEVFERARVWVSLLTLLITAAVMCGVERRRSRDRDHLNE